MERLKMERQPQDREKPETPDSKTDEPTEGLAALLGKYSDDPTWEEFQESIRQHRREIDEINKEG